MPIDHVFTSPRSDGPDATQIQPSHWNDAHTLPDFDEIVPNGAVTYRRTIELDTSEVLALGWDAGDFDAPLGVVELIPAPGAGKMIQITSVTAVWTFGTIPFSLGLIGLSLESIGTPVYDFQRSSSMEPDTMWEDYLTSNVSEQRYLPAFYENKAIVLAGWNND